MLMLLRFCRRFVVFYNGKEKRPEQEVLKLSDAYHTDELDPELELKVTVLNINSGNNKELMESCRTLREYMQYVNCVRYYMDEQGMNLSEAVEHAVNECIEKGIMADFLRENKAEAVSMSIFEYNEAEEKEKMRKAEYAAGMEHLLTVIDRMTADGLAEQIPKLSQDADFL